MCVSARALAIVMLTCSSCCATQTQQKSNEEADATEDDDRVKHDQQNLDHLLQQLLPASKAL